MNHFGLRLISDWSPIYKQTDPCAHPDTADPLIFDNIDSNQLNIVSVVVIVVLVFVTSVLIFLWQSSERVQRSAKKFNFKLPEYIPPETEQEPFMPISPSSPPVSPPHRKTSLPNAP